MKYLLLFLLAFGCSFRKSQLANQTKQGHQELYSEPSEPRKEKLSGHVKRIILASTNDVHGQYQSVVLEARDVHSKKVHTIEVGGAAVMSSYFDVLRKVYGNVVLVDSGDVLPADTSRIKEAQTFYSKNSYDAFTVGLDDFNLRVPKGTKSASNLFKDFASESEVPLVLSNLYDLKSGLVVEWKGTRPYVLKEIDGVKVGIIGLVADDVVPQTPVDNRVGLYVESMLQSTLGSARLLRSLGAEIIVVLTHQGINCGDRLSEDLGIPLEKVNFEPHAKDVCDLGSPLGNYLERLPPHLVDVVVGGRNHRKTVNYVNETLVISGFEGGKSFSYVEFFVDTQAKKILPEKTVVHQPVLTCHEFFKDTEDCFTGDPTVDHSARMPAKFLGKEISADPMMKHLFTRSGAAPRKWLDKDALAFFHASLVFSPSRNPFSQLALVTLEGRELLRILEEDFNHPDRKNYWKPSPFAVKKKELFIELNGERIDPAKSYVILSDMKSIQEDEFLKSKVARGKVSPLTEVSWNAFPLADEVKSGLAAGVR